MKLIAVVRGIVSGKQQNVEDAIIVFDKEERKRLVKSAKRRKAIRDRKSIETGQDDQYRLGAPFRQTKEYREAMQRSRLGLMKCKDGTVKKVSEVYGKDRKAYRGQR